MNSLGKMQSITNNRNIEDGSLISVARVNMFLLSELQQMGVKYI